MNESKMEKESNNQLRSTRQNKMRILPLLNACGHKYHQHQQTILIMIVKRLTVSIPVAVPSSLSVGEQQQGFVNEGLLLLL